MPIDIKWIRNNPSVVQEWQRLRRRRHSFSQDTDADADTPQVEDIVQEVMTLDAHCRKILQQLNDQRTLLHKLQKRLRPPALQEAETSTTSNNISRTNNEAPQNEEDTNNIQSESEPNLHPSRQEGPKQQMIELQTSIAQLQLDWKVASDRVEQALCKVASPVDVQVHRILVLVPPNARSPVAVDRTATPHRTISNGHPQPPPPHRTNRSSLASSTSTALSFDTNLGLDLSQALFQYTRHYFRHYPMVRLPATTPIRVDQQDSTSSSLDDPFGVDLSLAHAMWDCGTMSTERATTSAAAAAVAAHSDDQQTTMPCTISTKSTIPHLDAWIGLVARQRNNNRSSNKGKNSTKGTIIFGAKQLPQYTALWTIPSLPFAALNQPHHHRLETFEIIALTAGSLYESRTIQGVLLQELLDFLSSLFVTKRTQQQQQEEQSPGLTDGMADKDHTTPSRDVVPPLVQTRVLETSGLEMHELSRIVIEATRHTDKDHGMEDVGAAVFTLGTVSNFGDAASRACGLQFSGGGGAASGAAALNNTKLNTIKDYVHIVRATLCPEGILQWLILDPAKPRQEGEHRVAIPKVIAKYMVTTNYGNHDPDVDNDGVGTIWFPMDQVASGDALSHALGLVSREVRNQKGKDSTTQKQLQESTESQCKKGNRSVKSNIQPKFPLTTAHSKTAQQSNLEALSCPYGFLFG